MSSEGAAPMGANSRFWQRPFLLIVAALAVLVVILSQRVIVPIGPMYWDTYLYIDAAHRIGMGQLPSVDFDMPVGPLGYYLFAWGLKLLPQAQPLLLAQWSMLVLTVPLILLALSDLGRRPGLVLVLLVPFLVFAVAPANAQVYNLLPGFDGFGIYNRHVVTLLYVLLAALLFCRDGWKLAVVCAGVMLALFLVKITGFLVGGLFGCAAILAGRMGWRSVAMAALLFALPLLVLEFATGMVSAYLSDIAALVGNNGSTLLPRFRMVVTTKIDVLLPACLLVLVLLWAEWSGRRPAYSIFDSTFWWLAVAVVGGAIFETQNTGSQEFIFLWPVLGLMLVRVGDMAFKTRVVVFALAAFALVPTITTVVAKSVKTVAAGLTYEGVDAPLMRNLAQVSARSEILKRAEMLEEHYASHRDAYQDLALKDEPPSWHYYAEVDNHLHWVLSVNSALEALLKFEADNSVRMASLMLLDFADPIPWLLDRRPTPHIQIGADASRTITSLSPEARAAVEATDGVLRPNCPVTFGRLEIQEIYGEALSGRQVIALNGCWDLLVRPGLVPSTN